MEMKDLTNAHFDEFIKNIQIYGLSNPIHFSIYETDFRKQLYVRLPVLCLNQSEAECVMIGPNTWIISNINEIVDPKTKLMIRETNRLKISHQELVKKKFFLCK